MYTYTVMIARSAHLNRCCRWSLKTKTVNVRNNRPVVKTTRIRFQTVCSFSFDDVRLAP